VVNQATASSSTEWSWDNLSLNLVRGQESTMWDIVCFSSQGHRSVDAWFHFFLQAPQWPCAVQKWLTRDHCCHERLKSGCRIVRSSTREKLTIWADFQFSFHWLLMSTRTRSCHKGFLDGRQACRGLVISEWTSQLSHAIIFSMSLHVAVFLRAAGNSMLARTGNHGKEVEHRVRYQRWDA